MAEPTPPQPAPATPPPLSGISKSFADDMLEPGESILTVVHRSLVGLVGIYLVAIVAVGAILVLFITLSPDTFDTSSNNISPQLSAIMIVAAVLLVLILFTATYVYRQSRLLITDRSLVQIMQKTLFNRKVSRLSMSNVEDVNEEQRGIISGLFNYGTLTIQTAGTEDNFVFTLCPNPTRLADKIIEARQAYAEKLKEEDQSH
jgi:membrane protein YdbS with pleckstrin-like domain